MRNEVSGVLNWCDTVEITLFFNSCCSCASVTSFRIIATPETRSGGASAGTGTAVGWKKYSRFSMKY